MNIFTKLCNKYRKTNERNFTNRFQQWKYDNTNATWNQKMIERFCRDLTTKWNIFIIFNINIFSQTTVLKFYFLFIIYTTTNFSNEYHIGVTVFYKSFGYFRHEYLHLIKLKYTPILQNVKSLLILKVLKQKLTKIRLILEQILYTISIYKQVFTEIIMELSSYPS